MLCKGEDVISQGLGASVMVQVRIVTNGDSKPALDLWNELEQIYTASKKEANQKIRNRMDTLFFDENQGLHRLVSQFSGISGEFAIYDEKISEREKTSKLIRSLPPSFTALYMVYTISNASSEDILNAI